MENYIVRIYRRGNEQNAMAGIVEVVETQEKKAFASHDELIAILDSMKFRKSIVWAGKKDQKA